MDNYITFKIKKKYLIFIIVLMLSCGGIFGFLNYRYYNPDINVQISESTTGNNLKVEAPHISYGGDIPATIDLKLQNIMMQHEYVCMYLKENYASSDIKLDMSFKDDKAIMNYHGNVITLDGKQEEYKKKIKLEFTLDVHLTKK